MKHAISNLIIFFDRELDHLAEELKQFNSEDDLWKIQGEIKNAAGNLCLHLNGNLQHFIGATLGRTGYVRNRDSEFQLKGIPKAELIKQTLATKEMIRKVLLEIDEKTFYEDYPLEVNNTIYKTDFFLQHLLLHLQYHIGQINYLRRM